VCVCVLGAEEGGNKVLGRHVSLLIVFFRIFLVSCIDLGRGG